jgi:hypothetical protein
MLKSAQKVEIEDQKQRSNSKNERSVLHAYFTEKEIDLFGESDPIQQ